MNELLQVLPILLVAGLAAGFINTLASSGSAVSLPILVMLGFSEGAANATNRLPVLFGFLMALWTFHRAGQVDWGAAAKTVLPATAGSVVGVVLAQMLPNQQMGWAITAAVLCALVLLFTKLRDALARELRGEPRVTLHGLVVLFFVGVWFGFIVLDGATYLLLVLILMFGFDLPRANALKAFLGVATTLVPIAMFAHSGSVQWTEGVVLSAGSIVGGHLGARLSGHARARIWVFRLLVAVILLELVHLGARYFFVPYVHPAIHPWLHPYLPFLP